MEALALLTHSGVALASTWVVCRLPGKVEEIMDEVGTFVRIDTQRKDFWQDGAFDGHVGRTAN